MQQKNSANFSNQEYESQLTKIVSLDQLKQRQKYLLVGPHVKAKSYLKLEKSLMNNHANFLKKFQKTIYVKF